MKSIKIQVKKVGGSFMLPIPKSIAELMDWSEGDYLNVPFHDFIKVTENEMPIVNTPEPSGKESVTVHIGANKPKQISQNDVIKILNDPNPKPKLKMYRTAYILWDGKRFGVKNICKELFGFEDFNTVQGEKYLNELGFQTFRE